MVPDENGLTPDERRRFDELPREVDPPPGLESRVLGRLEGEGLLTREGAARSRGDRTGRRGGTGPRWVARPGWSPPLRLAAAAVVAFLLLGSGFWAGRRSVAPLPGTEPGFLLALHEGPEFDPFTDANYPARYEAYNRWIAGLREGDRFVTGLPLDSTAYMVLPGPGEPAAEARFARTEDGWVDGLFVIRARDYSEALEIARSAPHLEFGGRIAVRRIEPIG